MVMKPNNIFRLHLGAVGLFSLKYIFAIIIYTADKAITDKGRKKV